MKNKNWIKTLAIVLGSLLVIVLLANIGLNLWIKYKLPSYLKNNTDYQIKYDKLDLDLGTGNIFASHIFIENKDASNTKILRIKGSVDTLRVNSFGILDLIFRKEISISDAELIHPKISLLLAENQPEPKVKKDKKPLSMKHLQIKNGEISVFKTKEEKVFSAKQLSFLVDDFLLNEESEHSALPFQFSAFSINGKELFFKNKMYQAEAASLMFEENQGALHQLKLNPVAKDKTQASLESLKFKLNNWKIADEQLHLDIDNVELDGLDAQIIAQQKKEKAKNPTKVEVSVRQILVKNSNLSFTKNNQPLALKGINAQFSNISINTAEKAQKERFKMGDYQVKAQNLAYTMRFYQLNTANISLSDKEIYTEKFSLKPRYSRNQFIKMIPTERDLFDIAFNTLKMNGKWDFFSDEPVLNAETVLVDNVKANIFRSKLPPDDLRRKPMYSELLRNIQFPMFIKQIKVVNSHLEYEEDTPKSNGPGKLTFANFNMSIQNLNSGKMKNKPTQVPVDIACQFFETSPMRVHWVLDTQQKEDKFSISGSISGLSAERINTFVVPYLKVRTAGHIQNLEFDFKGNKNGIGGDFKLKHKDLKVSLLNDEGKKKKFLSAIINMVIKTDSEKHPEAVKVEQVPRDNTKSFFNLFWKGIESGLVRTLVGNTAENMRQDMKDK